MSTNFPVMAQRTLCKYNQISLEKAPYLFFDKLEAVLASSENQYVTNGWKAIAALPELAITAEKVGEIEASGTPVANFLRYLVFSHPRKSGWTVQWMEDVAKKICNLRIVKEFKIVKKRLEPYQCELFCFLLLVKVTKEFNI